MLYQDSNLLWHLKEQVASFMKQYNIFDLNSILIHGKEIWKSFFEYLNFPFQEFSSIFSII